MFLKFHLIATVMVSASGFAKQPVEKENNQNVLEQKNELILGVCHITITDTRTGEVVYEIELLANTPEECEQMGEDTLDAIVKGEL